MSVTLADRSLAGDWHDGKIPGNVVLAESAHLETTYSFLHFRSEQPEGVRISAGATVYLGTMFDVGRCGQISVGQFALVHGAWIICDAAVEIGDYSLISWNVVLMDNYRASRDLQTRRRALESVPRDSRRRLAGNTPAQPIRIGRNVWIGFDCCVLPGVAIGEGAVVGARSTVFDDVPPFTLVAGNPARVIRRLENDERPETALL